MLQQSFGLLKVMLNMPLMISIQVREFYLPDVVNYTFRIV